MLNVASPATLDKYAEGIRVIYATHRQWTVIMAADERLRREQRDNMAEKCLAEPPSGHDPASLRNSIIRESAYTIANSLAERQYFEVVAPQRLRATSAPDDEPINKRSWL